MIDVRLQLTCPTMMGPSGVRIVWWAQARTCGPCVGKYYTYNLFGFEATSTMVLNDKSLITNTCVHSLIPIVELVTQHISYNSQACAIFTFQVKTKYSCTVDGDIASKDHDTCIG